MHDTLIMIVSTLDFKTHLKAGPKNRVGLLGWLIQSISLNFVYVCGLQATELSDFLMVLG